MTKKIFRAIMLSTIIVLLCGIIVILGFLYDYFAGLQKSQLTDTLNLAASAIEKNGNSLDGLESDRYRFTLISPDGIVLADTKSDTETLENHSDRIEFIEAEKKGYGESVRYSKTLMEKTMYSAKKLSDGSVLRISISRATVGFLLLGTIQPTIVILIAAFILSDILAHRLANRIVEPLNKLNLDDPLENDAYEELSPLLSRINRQHEKIDSQMRELRRKTDEFGQITANLREGLVLLDNKGIVLSINPTAKKLFGAPVDPVGCDFLTVDRTHEMTNAVAEAVKTGHSEFIRNTGSLYWQFDISRIDSGGEHIGAVILAFDITERERAEEMRREFTANVSHELKTPLQGIIGSAELIENGMVKDEDLPRFVGHIHSEAKRLVTLIGDIIELSELDEGVELPMEPVNVGEVAREVVGELEEEAKKKNIAFESEIADFELTTNQSLLHEVIYNLCDNAIKYNKEDGSVKVTVAPSDTGVTIKIADTGIGIPEEHQSHVFERFYRVDKSHSKASGGTGLGLSIIKHAVMCLGGKVELESTVGKGTTVTVLFKV